MAANMNAGLIASYLYNVNRGKDVKPVSLKDTGIGYYGEFEEDEKPVQTVDDQAKAIEALAAALGAKRVKREDKKKARTKRPKMIKKEERE